MKSRREYFALSRSQLREGLRTNEIGNALALPVGKPVRLLLRDCQKILDDQPVSFLKNAIGGVILPAAWHANASPSKIIRFLYLNPAPGKKSALIEVSPEHHWVHTQRGLYVMLPFTAAFDVAFFPLQVFFYGWIFGHPC